MVRRCCVFSRWIETLGMLNRSDESHQTPATERGFHASEIVFGRRWPSCISDLPFPDSLKLLLLSNCGGLADDVWSETLDEVLRSEEVMHVGRNLHPGDPDVALSAQAAWILSQLPDGLSWAGLPHHYHTARRNAHIQRPYNA